MAARSDVRRAPYDRASGNRGLIFCGVRHAKRKHKEVAQVKGPFLSAMSMMMVVVMVVVKYSGLSGRNR
jgi:hypothetical protein